MDETSPGDSPRGDAVPIDPRPSAAGQPGVLAEPTRHAELAGSWQPLDARTISYWRVSSAVVAAVLTVAQGVALVVVGIAESWGLAAWLWAGGAAALLTLTWMGVAFTWPRLRYRHARYLIQPQGLEIRQGVWWRAVSFVPRSRVQHIDVQQGPIERHFGLAHLVVHTAGTISSSVALEGLAHSAALVLRDYLVQLAASPSSDAV